MKLTLTTVPRERVEGPLSLKPERVLPYFVLIKKEVRILWQITGLALFIMIMTMIFFVWKFVFLMRCVKEIHSTLYCSQHLFSD